MVEIEYHLYVNGELRTGTFEAGDRKEAIQKAINLRNSLTTNSRSIVWIGIQTPFSSTNISEIILEEREETE